MRMFVGELRGRTHACTEERRGAFEWLLAFPAHIRVGELAFERDRIVTMEAREGRRLEI